MEALKTFDIQRKRLSIYRDGVHDHPFDNTDAPIEVFSISHERDIWYRHESNYLPIETTERFVKREYISVYLNCDRYTEWYECQREDAKGVIRLHVPTWARYSGITGSADGIRRKTRRALRGFLEEFLSWANGDVFGYRITKTFVKDGKTYDTDEDIDSCWGFYGRSALKTAFYGQITAPAFRRALKAWAKSY